MISIISMLLTLSYAAQAPTTTEKVLPPTAQQKKLQAAKNNMSFDNQLVEGQIYRPDLSVVTGDTALTGHGLIRLRPDFTDHMQFETSQEIK